MILVLYFIFEQFIYHFINILFYFLFSVNLAIKFEGFESEQLIPSKTNSFMKLDEIIKGRIDEYWSNSPEKPIIISKILELFIRIILALFSSFYKTIKQMSLTFAQRLSKIKKKTEEELAVSQPSPKEKVYGPASSKKIKDFEQHHSDLKSMLQMLECEKNNSNFCTPVKSKRTSK